jgi:hypothetical protein
MIGILNFFDSLVLLRYQALDIISKQSLSFPLRHLLEVLIIPTFEHIGTFETAILRLIAFFTRIILTFGRLTTSSLLEIGFDSVHVQFEFLVKAGLGRLIALNQMLTQLLIEAPI